jgi:leucyl aminopeptidase
MSKVLFIRDIAMFPTFFIVKPSLSASIPVYAATAKKLDALVADLSPQAQNWLQASGWKAKDGQSCCLPDDQGHIERVLFCLSDETAASHFELAKLAQSLPDGVYHLAGALPHPTIATLAFALGHYRYERYLKAKDSQCPRPSPRLVCPEGVDFEAVKTTFDAVCFTRDLINCPANDMGPAELAEAALVLARHHEASCHIIVGDDLLAENFPMIYAVGAAATEARAPRLIDMQWGEETHPKVTLVGKGVCFDTGGLDIKPSSAMLIMKKDMGGAANVLGLAHMIMASRVPVRLRVLIPAVENAISGAAFRPGDILSSRKGLSVEIGNTDAEGRLVLADALALADTEEPELLIDMATLTGAARVALGPDLPALMTDSEDWAGAMMTKGVAIDDPVWRLPFWSRYDSLLKSSIADVNHVSNGPYAGAITAGLFLKRFVEKAKTYMHLDVFAWTPSSRPGRPEGGEAQAIRTLFSLIQERYK